MKVIGESTVHPIGIGTWQMGGGMEPDYSRDEEVVDAIQYSLSKGQNHIDTAQIYGGGHTSELVGRAILEVERKDLFIASKVWKTHANSGKTSEAAEIELERLQIDQLDLFYLHAPWQEIDFEDAVLGLVNAVEEGLVASIGLSNVSLDELKQAQDITGNSIVAVQNHYNALHTDDVDEELREYCENHNIALVAYRPLERRLLADQCDIDVIQTLASKYDATPAQIALAWLLQQENVHAIPKAISKNHIDENLSSLEIELSEIDIDKINEITQK